MSRKKFVHNNIIWVPRVPIDGNGATYGGDFQFACMKNFAHATCFWLFGNIAADATISIEQAKDIGGNSAKAYTIDTLYKQQCNAGTNYDQTKFIEEAVNATSRTIANASEDSYLFMVEIEGEQLDVSNGFDCLRPKVVNGAGATLVTMGVIFSNPRFQGRLDDPRQNMSPLAGEQQVLA